MKDQKDATSKSVAPGATDTFQEGADGSPNDYKPTYYGDDTLAKHSPSYAVYHDKTDAASSGVLRTQDQGPQGSNGRRPPVQQVTEAKEETGTTIRCIQKQTGLNRYPINEHEEKEKHHGPNN